RRGAGTRATRSRPRAARRPPTWGEDALRNRTNLLRAAGERIALHGTAVPLDEIARAAGVSSGTLYRNFASRHDLVRALYDVLVDRFDALVAELLVAPSGWDAIVGYVDGVIAIATEHPELAQVFTYMRREEPGYRPGDQWVEPAERVAERAHREGSLRTDVTATDLTYLPHLLVPMLRWVEPQRHVLLARMRALLLDALRPLDGHGELPEQPLSVAELRAGAFSGTSPR